MPSQSLPELLPLLAPLILLEMGLLVLALRDLVRRKRVRFDNKLIWGALIVLFGVVGPLAYFTLGRED
ncbi:MAG: PLDc_N domain-containing protein [Chloroflexota bacterium]|nr:MAG: PLDc_N domain-containing protein [Chloroflexota bacterium]